MKEDEKDKKTTANGDVSPWFETSEKDAARYENSAEGIFSDPRVPFEKPRGKEEKRTDSKTDFDELSDEEKGEKERTVSTESDEKKLCVFPTPAPEYHYSDADIESLEQYLFNPFNRKRPKTRKNRTPRRNIRLDVISQKGGKYLSERKEDPLISGRRLQRHRVIHRRSTRSRLKK